MNLSAEAKAAQATRWLLFSAVGVCYVLLLPLPGTMDVRRFWLPWVELMREHGLAGGYAASGTDYPPGAFVLLWLVLRISELTGLPVFALLKGLLVLAAWLGGWVFWCWRRSAPETLALLLAVMLSSAAHGYLDVCYLAPLLLAWREIDRGRPGASAIWFGLAVAIKWQPLVIAPFWLAGAIGLNWENLGRPREWVRPLGAIAWRLAVIGGAALLLFDPARVGFSLHRALIGHTWLSGQALNFNWIVQFALYWFGHLPRPMSAHPPAVAVEVARLLFVATYGCVWVAFMRRRRGLADLLWFAWLGFSAYFTFNIGVHENHPFVALVLVFAALAAPRAGAYTRLAFVALLANLNLLLFYGLDGLGRIESPTLHRAGVALALLNTLFFAVQFRPVAGELMARRT